MTGTGTIDPGAASPRRRKAKAPPPMPAAAPAGEEGERRSPAVELRDLTCARMLWNDIGNAERLRARHGEDLIWVPQIGWLVWDGKRWNGEDGEPEAMMRAHQTAKAIYGEAAALSRLSRLAGAQERLAERLDELRAMDAPGPALAEAIEQWAGDFAAGPDDYLERVEKMRRFASQSGNAGKISAMLTQAAPYLRRPARALDGQPFVVNVANGTLDLEPPTDDRAPGDGAEALRPHRREDLVTMLAGVDHDREKDCPRFRKFLSEILPDEEVRLFVQRWFGYCLTGDISEQALAIFYGTGANGKSTLLDTIKHVLGDYVATVPIQTFMHDDKRRGGDATPDLARLPGRRIVLASEPEVGARLSESVIKSVTGGEDISARKLFKDMFEYTPAFKVILSCNQKPSVRGQDEGIWRRMLMVPFTVTIPPERRVPLRIMLARLQAEAPGILNWALDGYLMWREMGLAPPQAVRDATEEYRLDSDPMGEFLRLCTMRQAGRSVQAMVMYRAYAHWARANAIDPVSPTLFGRRMGDRGYHKTKAGNRYYLDVDLDLEAEGLQGFSPDGASSSPAPGGDDADG